MSKSMFKTSVIFLVMISALLLSNGLVGAAEEIGIDFEVPPPENSELLGNPNIKLFNTDLKGATYKSQENIYRVMAFYNNFFSQQGFKKTLDTTMAVGSDVRHIQFRKQSLVVDVALTPKPDGTEVGIAKYILDETVKKLEDKPLSVNDSIFAMPKADMPGEDLDIVSRPPSSVRLADLNMGGTRYLTYTTKVPLQELRQFYKDDMKHGEWQRKSDIDMAELTGRYKKLTGRKDLGLGKSRFPIQGSRDLEEVASQGYVLEFAGSGKESVKVTIMPGFFGKKPDNIVQIAYTEDSYERK